MKNVGQYMCDICGCPDLLYPDDGMRKLRQMEMTTGVWTMQVTMQVESRDLVIIDRQSEVSESSEKDQ